MEKLSKQVVIIFLLKRIINFNPTSERWGIAWSARQSLLESQNLNWNGRSYLVNETSLEVNDVWESAGKPEKTVLLGNSLRGLIEARVYPIWIEGESHE